MTEPTAETAWHALDGAQALAALDATPGGLTGAEAARRLARHGPNALPEGKRSSLLAVFARQFASPLIYLLVVAAIIAIAVGERGDAIVIGAILMANAVIGTFQEGRAERSMRALRKLTALRTRALRDGEERDLAASEVVPGDVLVLSAGDAVPADARILDGSRVEAVEAVLTGESQPAQKRAEPAPAGSVLGDRWSMLHAGTHLSAGRARAVAVATGGGTELGRIAALTRATETPPTPLERRVASLGRVLVVLALVIFALVLAVGLLRGVPLAEIFMVAVSQLVSVVPEGLPVAMTVGLAAGMQRMAARRAIVRRLSAVESLGSTTVICSDKTGTLTRGENTAVAVRLDGRDLSVEGVGYEPVGRLLDGDRPVAAASDPSLRALLEASALCNDAALVPPGEDDPRWRALGDPTEGALLSLARKGGIDPEALRRLHPRTGELPFDAAARLMATVHDGPGGGRTVVKGAPEALLPLCSSVRAGDATRALDEGARRTLLAASDRMAADALRVLAFAEAAPLALDDLGFEALDGKLTLLGLVGQVDPPRPEAREAVARCRSAGIRPIMITGDHRATGLAVARALGMAGEEGRALDGAELEAMGEAELDRAVAGIPVFARVAPSQKLRIVEALQRQRQVVAMTGDGVNDAPALVRADVGVAMGRTGTEVAKEAAAIVVTDDNFATIVDAVAEGRVVYRNVRKALLLLLSTGLAEVLVLLSALLLGYPLPFPAVQILWNNVVTEGTITVNLGMEPAEGDEMQRPPIRPSVQLLGDGLLPRMALMSATITLVTFGYFAIGLANGLPFERVRTGTFTLLAVCEWFNLLNCRSESRTALRNPLHRNPWLMAGLGISVALQLAVIYWEPLGRVFRTVPLPPLDLAIVVAVGSLVLWAEELRKLVAGHLHGSSLVHGTSAPGP
ncbi:MAG TPA: HAD-IC family P-type ATPase [Anaeromyxobacteraceae bacterium]|nr:HAD-IC family P-type ATPase [Anaeromyxobacteraceae bacterium]